MYALEDDGLSFGVDLLARHNEVYGESTQHIGRTDASVDLVADLAGKVEEGGHCCE